MVCKRCGAELEPEAKFCTTCGADAPNAETAQPEPRQGRKRKRALMAVIGAAVLAAIGGGAALLLFFSQPISVDLSTCYAVHIEGYDGYATAHVEAVRAVQEAVLEKGDRDAQRLAQLAESVQYTLSSAEGISNGEEITAAFSYDTALAEELRIELTGTRISATAQGLEALRNYNPFEGLELTFSGYSYFGKAEVHGDAELPSLQYTVQGDGRLQNGTNVTVTVSFSAQEALAAGCTVTPVEQSFPVSGLTELEKDTLVENVELRFSGVSPNMTVDVENRSTDPVLQQIRYTVTPESGISEGDMVAVSALAPGLEGAEPVCVESWKHMAPVREEAEIAVIEPVDMPPVSAADQQIWMQFLGGGYRAYVTDAALADLQYAIADLNADGTAELLIASYKEPPFYTTWTFVLENGTPKHINTRYGYGLYTYLPNVNAVELSPPTKPFSGAQYATIGRLENNELVDAFMVSESTGGTWLLEENGSSRVLSDAERTEIFADRVWFSWKKVSSVPVSTVGAPEAEPAEPAVDPVGIWRIDSDMTLDRSLYAASDLVDAGGRLIMTENGNIDYLVGTDTYLGSWKAGEGDRLQATLKHTKTDEKITMQLWEETAANGTKRIVTQVDGAEYAVYWRWFI